MIMVFEPSDGSFPEVGNYCGKALLLFAKQVFGHWSWSHPSKQVYARTTVESFSFSDTNTVYVTLDFPVRSEVLFLKNVFLNQMS
jgi:hypothetical protein